MAAVCATAVSTWRSEEISLLMNAKDMRSRSFASGTTRMPFMPITTWSPALISRRRRQSRRPSLYHDHGVHALIPHFEPLSAVPDQRALIGGRIEIFRRAAVALGRFQFGVAGIDRRAAKREQLRHHVLHLLLRWRFHSQPQLGRIAVRSADGKLFHFEAAAKLHTASKICSMMCESIR